MRARISAYSRWVVLFLLVAVCSATALLGCGKKGDPVPPRVFLPPPVTDLKAVIEEGAVVLAWTMPDVDIQTAKVVIMRSELKVAGESCPGCPRQFAKTAELYYGDRNLLKEEEKKVRYRDSDIKGGRLYSYKVVICDDRGNCGNESNMAEMKIKD
jgi:hypothetical protein